MRKGRRREGGEGVRQEEYRDKENESLLMTVLVGRCVVSITQLGQADSLLKDV